MYPQRLCKFQGVESVVQTQGLNFSKTLPYHHLTGELTANEMLHGEQENHEAMVYCIVSQAAE